MSPIASSGLALQVLDTGRRFHRHLYEFLRLLGEFDHSGEWALHGARTCAHWVATNLDVEVCTVRDWLRVAHAVHQLPLIDAKFANAALSYSKVRALVRIATPANEAELCAIAERTTAGRLPCALGAWLHRNEEPEQTTARQQRSTSVKYRNEPDAMTTITLRLPPAAAGLTTAAIDQHVMRARRGAYDSTPKYFGILTAGWPSLAQQRAHALIDLLAEGSGKITTEVVVHVRGDGCTLDDGTPIDDHAVARLLDQSFIRALIHDAEQRPVNASTRRRHPTVRQQRVVNARQPRCVDCGSTELIHYDHNPDYQTTRRTHTEQLQPRCAPCHRARHRRQSPPSVNQ